MIDLESEKVLDIHCFALNEKSELGVEELLRFFTYGGPTVRGLGLEGRGVRQDSFSLRYFLRCLSDFLGCEPKLESVVEARRRRAKDFWEYVRELFSDAHIEAVVLDNGLYAEEIEAMEKEAPCKVHKVMRLEPLVDELFGSSQSYGEFVEKYVERLAECVRSEGYRGYKSVIAYRTGLNVGQPSEEEAKKDFEAAKAGLERKAWFGYYAKNLRDHLFLLAAKAAAELGVMLQVHTGLGDTDILGPLSNPILLGEALKREPLRDVELVLVHGGYPYTDEAAWMAYSFPKVHVEISSPIPPNFYPRLSSDTLTRTLQAAPVSKIVYGSDGHGLPELIWLSAKTAKKELAKALEGFVASRLITEEEAASWAQNILSENSSRLLSEK